MSASVTVFAAPTSWIESDAVAQCHQVAALDGMLHVAGMPDLHPGKGAPIGAAMTSSVLYPLLVGSDIGCGIAVFPIALKRPVPEKLAARFPDLDRPLDRLLPGVRAESPPSPVGRDRGDQMHPSLPRCPPTYRGGSTAESRLPPGVRSGKVAPMTF